MRRRFAARVQKVLQRHKDTEPSIGAYVHTIGVSAARFAEAYDAVQAYAGARAVTRDGGDKLVVELHRKTRSWGHLLAKVVPGFDRTKYGDKPNVAVDVVSDAKNLLGFVAEHETASGQPLPFSDDLRTDLEAAIAAVEAGLDGVGDADHNATTLRRDLAAAGEAFSADLIAFRGSLRTVLGRGHPDYQKLRVPSARRDDEDDDEVAAGLPTESEAIADDDNEEEAAA